MKQKYLLILFLSLANTSFGQPTSDKQTVIQMSIDIDELQQYYSLNKPLLILDNGIFPNSLNLTKFNQPVEFKYREDIFMLGRLDCLEFLKFEISQTKAEVIFIYTHEGLKIKLTFKKANDSWKLKTSDLIET